MSERYWFRPKSFGYGWTPITWEGWAVTLGSMVVTMAAILTAIFAEVYRWPDRRINAGFYGVAPSPVDNSVWGSSLGYPGSVIRLDPGSNPPATALAEIYEPPFPGYSPRGMDIDSQGVVWAVLASGHLASFDRRKCKVLNGPTATGQHCPEG